MLNSHLLSLNAYLTYERYDSHCKYFGIVSKFTKKPLNNKIGIDVTGPRNTETCVKNMHSLRIA